MNRARVVGYAGVDRSIVGCSYDDIGIAEIGYAAVRPLDDFESHCA
jgi:hypothetical protein